MPSINNFLKGFQDGLPGMKDYQHASRLYIDNNFKLMPKQKFLFHVVFNTDETLFVDGFNANERYELNMLVKACDLPKYNMSMEEKTQYNKKMYTALASPIATSVIGSFNCTASEPVPVAASPASTLNGTKSVAITNTARLVWRSRQRDNV